MQIPDMNFSINYFIKNIESDLTNLPIQSHCSTLFTKAALLTSFQETRSDIGDFWPTSGFTGSPIPNVMMPPRSDIIIKWLSGAMLWF